MKPIAPPPRAGRSLSAVDIGLALICISLVGHVLFVAQELDFSTPPSSKSRTIQARSKAAWYVRSGQWQADARTLVAAARWLLDADPVVSGPTNLISAKTLSDTNSAAAPAV